MAVRPDNGNCKRATGRTEQFYVMMKPAGGYRQDCAQGGRAGHDMD
jgi:hypothetical protein